MLIKFKESDVGWHKLLTCRQVTHEQGNSESVIEKGRKAVTSD
jgi:hypothetical protein